MTEGQWLSEPDIGVVQPIVDFVIQNGSERKLRLLSVALLRQRHYEDSVLFAQAIEAIERFADRRIARNELFEINSRVWAAMRRWEIGIETEFGDGGIYDFLHRGNEHRNVANATSQVSDDFDIEEVVGPALSDLLPHDIQLVHDIFGNPFRPVAFDPRWRSSNSVEIARTIYEDRAFDRMPILADALMDAGCEEPRVINHCQGPGPHVRGCWVVDLVLGKE